MTRRQLFMRSAALAAAQGGLRAQQQTGRGAQTTAATPELPTGWQPKSMLTLPETKVPRSRYPVIDWHTHMTHGSGNPPGNEIGIAIPPETALPVMDRKNIKMMVSLT